MDHNTEKLTEDVKAEVRSAAHREANRAMASAGEGLINLGKTLQSQDPEPIARDIAQFARKNPTSFLACAALLGFAALRVAPEMAATTNGAAR